MRAYFGCLISLVLFFGLPLIGKAELLTTKGAEGQEMIRSLESLRDLDYQTWQVVAYPEFEQDSQIVLRIVGYPGSLRINHPANLKVKSGIKEWDLKDITLKNSELVNDSRQAAAEFNLSPLLKDLTNNRPLRLFLPGVINELPIPPYVVSEWRSLKNAESLDEIN